MKLKKIYVYIIIAVLSVAIVVPILVTLDYPDKPIIILSDEDFQNYNFPGDGSISNPFRIEGWKFTNELETGNVVSAITIRNTTKHVVIQNCYVNDFHGGISLRNAAYSTIKIQNNEISECHLRNGISIYNCNNVIIQNNTLFYTSDAISLIYSDESLVRYNNLYFNTNGISLSYSDDVEVLMNNCSYNTYGLSIRESQATMIVENLIDTSMKCYLMNSYEAIWSQGVGISVFRGWFLEISNNIITNSSRQGILCQHMFDSVISYNNISYTTLAIKHGIGMYFFYSANNTVVYNLIEENRKYGMFFEESVNNTFHHNAFIQNGNTFEDHVFSQFGHNNTWYDSITLEGNYWQGWNVSFPYIIQEELSEDPYPLETNPVILDHFFPFYTLE